MLPLKRLFASSRHSSSQRDQQNLASLSQQELLVLIKDDSTCDSRRDFAFSHLREPPILVGLAFDEDSNRLQQTARKRIGELLEAERLKLHELTDLVSDQSQLLLLSSYSARAGLAVLEQLSDPALLLEVATRGASIQIRSAAAERITTREALEQLYQASQGRDKTVYKLAKQRLDVFKAEEAKYAQVCAQADAICDKLEQLARVEQDPQFQAKYDKCEQDWAALDMAPPAATEQRYGNIMAHFEQQRQAQERARARELAEQEAEKARREAQAQQLEQAHTQLATLVLDLCQQETFALSSDHSAHSVQACDAALAALVALEDMQPQRTYLQQLYRELCANASLGERLQQLEQADTLELQQRAVRRLRAVLEPAQALLGSPLPAPLAQAQQTLTAHEHQQREAASAERKLQRELEGLARQGLNAAAGGQVRRARGLHRATEEKRSQLTHIPETLAARLQALDESIARLSDWHEFAVTPKKHALIEAMQQLEHSTQPAEALARKIHDLQDQWREVSKGVPHHDESLWEQFQASSHRAFEPCKAYFEAQAQERDNNQAQREQLIAQVELYLNSYHWERPVWREVEQVINQAHREWRAAWPVQRQAAKEQQARFDPLMNQLHGKLNEHYSQCRAAKQQLIEQAQTLAEHSDVRSAVDGAKQLQKQWQSLAPASPKDERKLWKQFRVHCDTIFARRQESFDAADSERKSHRQAAEQIIAELRELQHQPLAQADAQQGQINALKTAFYAVGELPRKNAKAINEQFNQALKGLAERRGQARDHARQVREQQLHRAAEAIRSLELASVQNTATETFAEQARAAFAEVEHWPANTRELLHQRLEAGAQFNTAQQQASLEGLQLLCIRAEILADKPSPEADKAQRMAYQMQQLQKGLGQAVDSKDALREQWLAYGGVADADYLPLRERFLAVLG